MNDSSAKAAVALGLSIGLAASACSSSNNNGGRPMLTATSVAGSGQMFWSPFDSVPSPDAKQVYFVARTPEGNRNADTGAVFTVPATGGDVTMLASGTLSAPISLTISSDGTTLYIVDTNADDRMDHLGRIFSLPSSGGTPSPLTAADGTMPTGIDLVKENGADMLYFTGRDPSDGAPAVFKMSASGANRITVLKGAPLKQPSALAVNKSGVIYLTDGAATRSINPGGVFKIEGGAATAFITGLRLGFPSGIALALDESAIFVSALDPKTSGAVLYRYAVASKQKTMFNAGISQNTESAGLHRAREKDVYTWADANGCARCTPKGGVYIVK